MTVFKEWSLLCFVPQSFAVLPNFNYAFLHYAKKTGENRLENNFRPLPSLGFACKQSRDACSSFIDVWPSVIRSYKGAEFLY